MMTREERLEAHLADAAELIDHVCRTRPDLHLYERLRAFLGREDVKLVRELVTKREGGYLSDEAMETWHREAEQLLGVYHHPRMRSLARRVKLLVEELREDRERAQHAAWEREEARERSEDG